MSSRSSETNALVAIVFTLVILGIFYSQQGKGPESTLLRFLQGLERGDVQAVSSVVTAPDEPTFQEVASLFYQVVQSTPYFWVEQVQLQKDECILVVRFLHPRQGEIPMVVFLRRVPEGWKVDAWNTLRVYRWRWQVIR